MPFILLASNISRLLSNKDARSRCWWWAKKESFWVPTFCRSYELQRSLFFFSLRTLIIFHFIYQHITTLHQSQHIAKQFCWDCKKCVKIKFISLLNRGLIENERLWPNAELYRRFFSSSVPIINSNFFLCQRRVLSFVIFSNNVTYCRAGAPITRRRKMLLRCEFEVENVSPEQTWFESNNLDCLSRCRRFE